MLAKVAIVLIAALYPILGIPVQPTQECRAGPRVYLSVSSLANRTTLNQVELNWAGATPQDGEWIGLFSSDPNQVGVDDPLESYALSALSEPEGFFVTAITADNYASNSSSELGYVARCLDYHIAYMSSGGQILASNCLRLEPTWMTDMPGLGSLLIREVFIPGTHDTGAYNNYEPILSETLPVKYSATQDEDILAQLIKGVRYFDMRIANYGPAENHTGFWINHGVAQFHRLEVVVDQFLQFLENTEKELVIFDIHGLSYFNDDTDHHRLISYLSEQFAGFIIPPGVNEWSSTVSELWNQGSLIITYGDSNIISAYPDLLWTNVQHKWGDVRFVEDLYTYLEGVHADPPRTRAWSAMAELTPNALDVITDELGGLRKMADNVNRNVTSWYQGSWGQNANIVAVDFYRGADIVSTAIEWNKLRVKYGGIFKCAN